MRPSSFNTKSRRRQSSTSNCSGIISESLLSFQKNPLKTVLISLVALPKRTASANAASHLLASSLSVASRSSQQWLLGFFTRQRRRSSSGELTSKVIFSSSAKSTTNTLVSEARELPMCKRPDVNNSHILFLGREHLNLERIKYPLQSIDIISSLSVSNSMSS